MRSWAWPSPEEPLYVPGWFPDAMRASGTPPQIRFMEAGLADGSIVAIPNVLDTEREAKYQATLERLYPELRAARESHRGLVLLRD